MSLMDQDRQVKFSCPSLDGTPYELLFRKMSGSDGLSELFEYNVELVSTSANVPMDKVLGFEITLSFDQPLPFAVPPARRYLNGYVASFNFVEIEGELTVYHAVLRPKMWLLTRNEDCRIWEDKSVPEVVEGIFKDYGLVCDTKTFLTHDRGDDYKRREYCVQYNETDFDFVSRLLEEEGIHYFFRHANGKHELILADSIMGHVPEPGYGTVPFHLHDSKSNRDAEAVTEWSIRQSVEADHVALGDFDFIDPRHEHISARATSQTDRKHPRAGHFERYHYPESVVKMREYGSQMAESLAKVRAQELHARCELIVGTCNAKGVVVGGTFGLSGHPREELNKPAFLVIQANFNLKTNDYSSGAGDSQELTYTCKFAAINSQTAFRPARKTPKPLVHGPQTAIVVGSGGSPIHTDKYGRVRLSFPWTRPDTKGKASVSCWSRVSQTWAGQNWGSMQVPHVGHEVIVSFLDGDPDRPIVTGRVYNGQNMPWQKLPDHATRSYIRDQVGNRIVMQSKEEEKGISIHTPSLDTHLWLGKQDGLELPDGRDDFQKIAASVVKTWRDADILPAPSTRGGIHAKTAGDIVLNSAGNIYNVADGSRIDLVHGPSIKIENNSSTEITVGIKESVNVGAEFKVNVGASVEVTAAAKLAVGIGISAEINWAAKFEASRGVSVHYSKEKTFDLSDRSFGGAEKEIRHQVYAIPDLLGKVSKTQFLLNGFLGDSSLLQKFKLVKPLADGKAEAETVLTPDKVLIRCGETIVHLTKSGDVIIKTPKGKGKVVLNTQEVKLNADKNFVVVGKATNIDTKTFKAASNLEVKK